MVERCVTYSDGEDRERSRFVVQMKNSIFRKIHVSKLKQKDLRVMLERGIGRTQLRKKTIN